jgi:hypothetical protein
VAQVAGAILATLYNYGQVLFFDTPYSKMLFLLFAEIRVGDEGNVSLNIGNHL